MNNLVSAYVARKVIEDFLNESHLDEDLCEELNQYPLIDSLRAAVEPPDIGKLLKLADSKSTKQAALALSMLRRHAANAEVRIFLRGAWSQANSYTEKYPLLWRLLDDPSLDSDRRNELFEFVVGNVDQFLSDVPAFFGSREEILAAYTARLADPILPPSKKWIYLISVAASDDVAGVTALLRDHLGSADDLSKRAAEKMLARVS